MPWQRHLLWIDSRAGLAVGVFVLAAAEWLAPLYALPKALVVAMGVANLGYGTFSFTLSRLLVRPPALLTTLVVANATWAVACVVAAVLFVGRASVLGIAQLLFEGAFVGGLAFLEWRWRDLLRRAP